MNADQSAQFFQFSCLVIRGRTRRNLCANLFRVAELHCGYTRENIPTDGISKDGKNIIISLIFMNESDLCRFQSEVIELVSVFSGHKRPLIDADDSLHPHELILTNQRTEPVSVAYTMQLQRVFKYQYDFPENASDNCAECDGYSNDASLSTVSIECANITDPEVCAQMIEDPQSPYWDCLAPEVVHIKEKAKCAKNEQNDPNNVIYMSTVLHCFFDALNGRLPKYPAMKIQYVRHDEERIPCPAIGSDPNPLGLPRRQRVTVRIIFWCPEDRHHAMLFLRRRDGVDIDANTNEIDLYFTDAIKAMTFLKWKEAQTERAWVARRQGISAIAFAVTEGIGEI